MVLLVMVVKLTCRLTTPLGMRFPWKLGMPIRPVTLPWVVLRHGPSLLGLIAMASPIPAGLRP